MHVLLSISWTTGLLITVGSLCSVDPAPWFGLGIGILVLSVIVLFREMRKIVQRNYELYDLDPAVLNAGLAARNSAGLTDRESTADPVAQSQCLSR